MTGDFPSHNEAMPDMPEIVRAARLMAAEPGFGCSCDDRIGQLLAVLAAAVPRDGRILELGTGAGVGTAWLVHGLGSRSDVELTTVEADANLATLAQRHSWPQQVKFIVDDAVHALPALGQFDLVFADAQGGKWERLDLSISSLCPYGLLVVDDMTPQHWWTEGQATMQRQVRDALLSDPSLATCELGFATGVLISARRE